MALKTKKEFADECGITTGNLSNYIGRGNVVASGDFIDDTFGKNVEFLTKRLLAMAKKNGAAPPGSEKAEEVPATPPAPTEINKTLPVRPPKALSKEVINSSNLDQQIKIAELEKVQETNRYLKIKADKAEGILIPTDAVNLLFLQYSKAITNSFRNSLESMTELWAHKHGLSAQEVAELRKKGIEGINGAVSSAIEEAKAGVINIVSEYSETKGRGERV